MTQEAAMEETEVGIRDLKAQLSKYLRMVKKGQSITITDRGKPIAQIIPKDIPIRDRIDRLVEAGFIEWNGHTLELARPAVRNESSRLVSDIIVEMRE
jgi:prevent-host-death family protein